MGMGTCEVIDLWQYPKCIIALRKAASSIQQQACGELVAPVGRPFACISLLQLYGEKFLLKFFSGKAGKTIAT
jgi:hypothetical protein